MKQYIKAEFELYKKNYGIIIGGAVILFIYLLLLLFSGVGGTNFGTGITLVGFLAMLFFYMILYFSPVSFIQNRQKVTISAEQILLCLGESKRVFIKIRLLAFFVFLGAILAITAVMQLPAYLIAGEQYSLLVFGIQELQLFAFCMLFLPFSILLPSKNLTLTFSCCAGFCGGIFGGMLGESVGSKDGLTDMLIEYAILAAVAVIFSVISIVWRFARLSREERGKKQKAR